MYKDIYSIILKRIMLNSLMYKLTYVIFTIAFSVCSVKIPKI